MESEEEQHMTTLLCMGFSDPATIRRALRLAKNDINEAVALLTNERPGLDYGGYEPMDSGGGPRGDGGGDGGGVGGSSRGGSGGGGNGNGGGGGGGFDPPPAYHEVVDAEVSPSERGTRPSRPGYFGEPPSYTRGGKGTSSARGRPAPDTGEEPPWRVFRGAGVEAPHSRWRRKRRWWWW